MSASIRIMGAGALLLAGLVANGCVISSEQSTASQQQHATESRWSCSGTDGKNVPADGGFYVTSFGCWTDSNGNSRGDPSDNCLPWCKGGDPGGYADFCSGLSGPACERRIHWYAADASRFGCFNKIRATNRNNGKSVVLLVIDKGPSCYIEDKVDHWALDISYPASHYLFGESKNVRERAEVFVEPVSADTPLGPDEDPIPFIGDGCRGNEDCDFVADGQAGSCSVYGSDADGAVGFCTIDCAGTCPEKGGKASTFCVSLDGGASGTCVSKASSDNGHCSALPDMEARVLPRFVGDSGASATTAEVCVPAS